MQRYSARTRSFLPDPHVEPIVVRSVVLRPVDPPPRVVSARMAHVTTIIFPQCQLALVACGDHLAWGGPKRSYRLTEERWLDEFTRTSATDNGACKRCLRGLVQPPNDSEVQRILALQARGIDAPWMRELLELADGRRPLKAHLSNHPFWQAVKLWQKQTQGSNR